MERNYRSVLRRRPNYKEVPLHQHNKGDGDDEHIGGGGVKRRQRHLHPGEEVAQSVGCKRDVGARFIDNSRRLKDVLDYVANGR
jgi:hypothetical protein